MTPIYGRSSVNIRLLRALLALLALLALPALTACQPRGGSPGPDAPSGETTAQGEASAPPGAVVRGEELPGRLLFVQEGVVWIWRENQGYPLFGQGAAWQPEWSPDGTRIVYIERGESYTDVMLADANGTHLEQLTFYGSTHQLQSRERIYDTMWAFYPIWSPDGTRITMVSQYAPPYQPYAESPAVDYNLSIYSLSLNGSGARRQLYADEAAHAGTMAYQPGRADGNRSSGKNRLIFTRASLGPEGSPQIYRLDPEREVGTPFPGAPPHSYDPAFSPDGSWLVFAAHDEDGRTDIWALPADAAEGSTPTPQRLTNLGMARSPVFSPDGTLLAFLAISPHQGGFDLWVVEMSTDARGRLVAATPRQVTHELYLDADSGLSWSP